MSTKNKQATKADITFDQTKIILKSIYEKANIKYYIQPCRDKLGNLPPCIKKVNSQGDMIMSEDERNKWAKGELILFPEDKMFEITSGKVYDLTVPEQKAEWDAIKNCPLIAKSRDERDAAGNLIIDGPISTPKKPTRNGIAELYIDRPGLETAKKVTRKQLVHKAQSFIYDDDRGLDGYISKAKLLGRNMSTFPAVDIIDYLCEQAEKNPQKIIDLYTGHDTSLRLLFIDAKDKKVIYVKNKLYLYGDNIVLGATDDAVLAWMKEPRNLKVLELIKKDTYPDMFRQDDLENKD